MAIVDPLVKRAEEILDEKKNGPYAHLYSCCKVMADYKELFSLGDDKPDAVFIGMSCVICSFVWSLPFIFIDWFLFKDVVILNSMYVME